MNDSPEKRPWWAEVAFKARDAFVSSDPTKVERSRFISMPSLEGGSASLKTMPIADRQTSILFLRIADSNLRNAGSFSVAGASARLVMRSNSLRTYVCPFAVPRMQSAFRRRARPTAFRRMCVANADLFGAENRLSISD